MRFLVLGPLTVLASDGRPLDVPEAGVRALLAVLLTEAGRTVSADRLVDELWGDRPPRNPAGALQTRVSRLRRALAEPGTGSPVESRHAGYLLRVAPEAVDAHRFATLTARAGAAGAAGDPRASAELLREALALWNGEPFAGVGDLPALRSTATRLVEERLTAVEALAEARLELGEHHAVGDELTALAAAHPLRERLRAAQLRALWLAGRQAEALAGYESLRVRLAEELGVDPGPELAALHRAILTQDPGLRPPPAASARVPEGRAAPLTALVGREPAVAAIAQLLDGHRLVTLTGPGGVGKTRLAEEVAERVAGGRPDGVRTVALGGGVDAPAAGGSVLLGAAPLGPVNPVAERLGAALGAREDDAPGGLLDALRARLRPLRLLLLLDNCEHLIGPAAATVRELLAAAPGLTVLATSREPLGLPGEAVWTVPPLQQADAEALFAARAGDSAPGFAVTEANAAAVATICRRLDRLPLALELAAARVRALGVHALAARLDDRFRLLTGGAHGLPPRQRTLRAVVDWSWDLLDADERALLRRLSVFAPADGLDLAAAEAVCGGERADERGEVVGPLIRLVDRSLVTAEDPTDTDGAAAEGPRYRLPETVAAYARERLVEAGELADLQARHLVHCTALAERGSAGLRGPEQAAWLLRLDRESGNLRAALDGAVRRRNGDGALRLAVALGWYWFLRGRLSEARRSLGEALAVAGTPAGGTPAGGAADEGLRSGAALWHAGFAALAGDHATARVGAERGDARAVWFLGHALLRSGADLPRGEALLARALGALGAAGDRWGTAAALTTRAVRSLLRGDLGPARDDAEAAHATFLELGDGWGRLNAGYALAALATIAGDLPRAERLHREGLRLAEELGLWAEAADRITGLGRVALLTGDRSAADALHRRSMALAARHGYAAGEVHAEIGLGLAARRAGDLDGAERHLRAALDWHRATDFGPGPALLLAELGFVAELRGEVAEAFDLHRRGLAAARESGDPRAVALALEGLAGAYASGGQPVAAARRLGAAARLREAAGAPLPAAERGDAGRVAAEARAALGAARFAREFRGCPPGGRGSDANAVVSAGG
ncbi:AfsR/SARP family transcriptional regulator [Streptomyces sp. 3MP-14]|uniref:AfsR/SARP family transcriptional regulator n=1 Tax=Streptomyces mimosae TaxID=2586635 RepID=A0A5N6AIL5_9ACTN|nr:MULTISPECIES: BTAD domain-containing putative transcriptional regulator [Streptomyces]KAB8167856.1 AfsR/SARP family transcriptional regulator [Streptomyces mimosae]KAB8177496.1 AfsR/SARP family transcriptional regulator [Streptomyces sp. 3MP-14]